MRQRIVHIATALAMMAVVAASPVHASSQGTKGRELTQISVESAGTNEVFHLFDLDHLLRDGMPHEIASESGTSATARVANETLVLSVNGFDYRLPIALLPRKTEILDLPNVERIETPGREYHMSFKRTDGSEDMIKVQRTFVDAID